MESKVNLAQCSICGNWNGVPEGDGIYRCVFCGSSILTLTTKDESLRQDLRQVYDTLASLIDEVLAVNCTTTPGQIEDLQRRIRIVQQQRKEWLDALRLQRQES